jgi:hypothetical protein
LSFERDEEVVEHSAREGRRKHEGHNAYVGTEFGEALAVQTTHRLTFSGSPVILSSESFAELSGA